MANPTENPETQYSFSFKVHPVSKLKSAIDSLTTNDFKHEAVTFEVGSEKCEITVRSFRRTIGFLRLEASGLLDFSYRNYPPGKKIILLKPVSEFLSHVPDDGTVLVYNDDGSDYLWFAIGDPSVSDMKLAVALVEMKTEACNDFNVPNITSASGTVIPSDDLRRIIQIIESNKTKIAVVDMNGTSITISVYGQECLWYDKGAQVKETEPRKNLKAFLTWLPEDIESLRKASYVANEVTLCLHEGSPSRIMSCFDLGELGDLMYIKRILLKDVTQTDDVTRITEVSQTDEVTQTADASQADEVTQTSEVSQTDEVTKTAEVSQTAEVTQTAEVSQADEVNQTEEVTQTADVSQADEVNQTAEVTQTADVSQADEVNQTTEVTQTAGVSQTDEEIQTAEVSQTEEASQREVPMRQPLTEEASQREVPMRQPLNSRATPYTFVGSPYRSFMFQVTYATKLKYAVEALCDNSFNPGGAGLIRVDSEAFEINVGWLCSSPVVCFRLEAQYLTNFEFNVPFGKIVNLHEIFGILSIYATEGEIITIEHVNQSPYLHIQLGIPMRLVFLVKLYDHALPFRVEDVHYTCEALVYSTQLRKMLHQLEIYEPPLVQLVLTETSATIILGPRDDHRWDHVNQKKSGISRMLQGDMIHASFLWNCCDSLRKASRAAKEVHFCPLTDPPERMMLRIDLQELGDLVYIVGCKTSNPKEVTRDLYPIRNMLVVEYQAKCRSAQSGKGRRSYR